MNIAPLEIDRLKLSAKIMRHMQWIIRQLMSYILRWAKGEIAVRVLICLLIVLVSAPAWAEWVKSWESKTSGTITYFDPDTIRKDGNLRRVWVLQDLRIRGKEYGEMSRRALWEYNCPEERFRSLQISIHTDPMAKGSRLLTDSDPSDWQYIPPSTGGAVLHKLVCAK